MALVGDDDRLRTKFLSLGDEQPSRAAGDQYAGLELVAVAADDLQRLRPYGARRAEDGYLLSLLHQMVGLASVTRWTRVSAARLIVSREAYS